MLKIIKRKIISWIKNNVINERLDAFNNPYRINFKENSAIIAPLELNGAHNVFLGANTMIEKGAWLAAFSSYQKQSFQPKISIGENVHIGHYACITAISRINIGDNCLISEYVYISDHFHGLDPMSAIVPAQQELGSKGNINIGERTFLGYRVSILSGVTLGKNCVVGAHSVVTKSFPDNCMIAGAPAKLIKKYCTKEEKWLSVNYG